MITNPYFRTVRQLADKSYADSGLAQYITRDDYADNPLQDVRSYLILEKEYLNLLEYIEPSNENSKTYSLRIRDLLIRTSTEVEANLKAIMRANKYSASESYWTMRDYQRVEKSHFLSRYITLSPYWNGKKQLRKPFQKWGYEGQQVLKWYQAYNETKHNRSHNLYMANMDNLAEAMSALVILISAQYYTETFTGNDYLIMNGNTEYEWAIGNYFQIKFPSIAKNQRYSFDHKDILKPNFLQKFDYDNVIL